MQNLDVRMGMSRGGEVGGEGAAIGGAELLLLDVTREDRRGSGRPGGGRGGS